MVGRRVKPLHRRAPAARVPASRRPWLVALAAVVALVQWLGVVHGVAHGGAIATAGIAPASSPAATGVAPASSEAIAHAPVAASQAVAPFASSLVKALFASHDESAPGCPLYDHTTHADALCDAGVPSGSDSVASVARWHGATSARMSRPHGFLARAPPTLG